MKKYDWLLFDLDNTLLDFSTASKKSLFSTFMEYGIECDEDLYKTYKVENGKVWTLFEEKKINTAELRKIRFKGFFNKVGISGIDPFEFNTKYLDNIIHESEAYEGVVDLLGNLTGDYKLSIVTNGLKEVQRPRLDKTEVTHFFDSIVVSDEIGVAKPDVEFFNIAYDSIQDNIDREKMLVIGDNLMSDVLGGHQFGVDTCWISHSKKNKTKIGPTHTIETVLSIHDVL